MNTKTFSKVITLLRVVIGWVFFYGGITKVLNPEWSAAFYLQGAKTFPSFYNALLQPDILPIINLLNAWGLTLIGISLIIGLWVRYSSLAGIAMMILYYLPILDFPKVGEHSFLIDEHIVYAVVLVLLYVVAAGMYNGLDAKRLSRATK